MRNDFVIDIYLLENVTLAMATSFENSKRLNNNKKTNGIMLADGKSRLEF